MLFSNQSGVGFERVELQQEFGDCREDDPEVFPFGRGNNSVKVLFGKEKKEVYLGDGSIIIILYQICFIS